MGLGVYLHGDWWIAVFYGLLATITCLLAWRSGHHVLQKLGLLLLLAWSASNVCVAAFGFQGAPVLVPVLDACIGVLTAILGYANRSKTAFLVFTLFIVVAGLHMSAWWLNIEDTYRYRLSTNIVFALQLLTVGAASVGLMASRLWTGDIRLHHSRASG